MRRFPPAEPDYSIHQCCGYRSNAIDNLYKYVNGFVYSKERKLVFSTLDTNREKMNS